MMFLPDIPTKERKAMMKTDFTIKPERRLCKVNGEYGYFHCWEQSASARQYIYERSEVLAIVEFEDRVARIQPWEVKFVDEENQMLHWMNEHERKEKKQ